MNIERRAACNLEWQDRRGSINYGNSVADDNINTLVNKVDPGEVKYSLLVKLVIDEDGYAAAYRHTAHLPATVHAKTGLILAAGDEQKAGDALHSTDEAIPAQIRVNKDFYIDNPEIPVMSFELVPAEGRPDQEILPLEQVLTTEAWDNIDYSFEQVERAIHSCFPE